MVCMMALLREIHGRRFTPSDHSPCVLEPGVRCLESYGTTVEGESDTKVSSSQSPLSLSLSLSLSLPLISSLPFMWWSSAAAVGVKIGGEGRAVDVYVCLVHEVVVASLAGR
jgi:hypothetical protein